MAKIVIMGAGGFGTALALILSKNRHQVRLWDRDKKLISHWQRNNFSDRYPYLKKHRFPKSLELASCGKIASADFDFIIISSSLAGLVPTLSHLDHFKLQTPIILIQKGMRDDLKSPTDIAREIFPKAIILQFTGAGFAKDLANGSPAGMVVVHGKKERSVAKKFAQLFAGSGVWPTCYTDSFGINIHNTLRTIASFEQGFVYGYFEKKFKSQPPVSIIAITFSAFLAVKKIIGTAKISKRYPYLMAAKSLISGNDIGEEMSKIFTHHESYTV